MSITAVCRFEGNLAEKDYIYTPACISLKYLYKNVNVIIETNISEFFEGMQLAKKPILLHIGGVRDLLDRKIISKSSLVFFYFKNEEIEKTFDNINRFRIPPIVREDLSFESITNKSKEFEIPNVNEICKEVERRGAQLIARSFYL